MIIIYGLLEVEDEMGDGRGQVEERRDVGGMG
jgi:hypothetical protein